MLLRAIVVLFTCCLGIGALPGAVVVPPDAVGDDLRAAAIWTDQPVPAQGAVHGAFRREFTVAEVPAQARLRIFAATRYQLSVNGTYVLRGPARFELEAAEYDTVDIAHLMRPGRNVLAVLVHRDRPTGRIRQIVPGLAVDLDLGQGRHLRSDGAWKAVPEASFAQTGGQWASLRDQRDATAMPEWRSVDGVDGAWPAAVPVDRQGSAWPRLVARRSALQREVDAPFAGPGGGTPTWPLELQPGVPVQITTPRIIQAYPVLEFEAAAGTRLAITYHVPTATPGKLRGNGTDTWRCREGRQTWIVDDTNACTAVTIEASGGPVRLHRLRLVEVGYPFDLMGAFTCPDPQLTHLWTMMARASQVLSEDAYVDCAERERVEWMECSPPMAQTTRVSMTTATEAGPIPSDPALLRAVLWRTAQTQRADGMVKAHTCSERWDKHAIMVDRTCDWVQLSREYWEHTGDAAFIREIWPAITRQLDAFLAKRTERGLIKLEEWADWGNHYKYRVFEGTALNAFMYAALMDGAALAVPAGDAAAGARFTEAAAALRAAMLAHLWDAKDGTMGAGLFDLAGQATEKRIGTYGGPAIGVGLFQATRHSAIYALRWNVIDEARREQLYQWVWKGRDETMKAENAAMIYYHLFEVLYAHDDPAADAWVLAALRRKWQAQLESPMQTSGESLGRNETIHCYSMYPVYVLSSYVLGVRLDGPVGRRALHIDPRLGDLPSASGTVVTELGLVPVAWTTTPDGLDFAVTIPVGVNATVRLPTLRSTVVIDGVITVVKELSNGRPVLKLGPGRHQGTVR